MHTSPRPLFLHRSSSFQHRSSSSCFHRMFGLRGHAPPRGDACPSYHIPRAALAARRMCAEGDRKFDDSPLLITLRDSCVNDRVPLGGRTLGRHRTITCLYLPGVSKSLLRRLLCHRISTSPPKIKGAVLSGTSPCRCASRPSPFPHPVLTGREVRMAPRLLLGAVIRRCGSLPTHSNALRRHERFGS